MSYQELSWEAVYEDLIDDHTPLKSPEEVIYAKVNGAYFRGSARKEFGYVHGRYIDICRWAVRQPGFCDTNEDGQYGYIEAITFKEITPEIVSELEVKAKKAKIARLESEIVALRKDLIGHD